MYVRRWRLCVSEGVPFSYKQPHLFSLLMHVPSHAGTLPAGAAPIPMPDTEREAEMLLILLDAGLYPRIRPEQSPEDEPNSGWGDGKAAT